MGERGTKTKQAILATATELFRRRGYDGTGVNLILDESDAPRGSLYFHFPGGKQQIAVEAVGAAGTTIGAGIDHILRSSDDLAEAVGRVVEFLAADLERSDYRRGCPVAAVALDAATENEPVRLACEGAFDNWLGALERRLRDAGWAKREASERAILILSAIEGGLVLARAQRDPAPLRAVARQLRAGPASEPA